jgi:hypothetical protein
MQPLSNFEWCITPGGYLQYLTKETIEYDCRLNGLWLSAIGGTVGFMMGQDMVRSIAYSMVGSYLGYQFGYHTADYYGAEPDQWYDIQVFFY